MPFRPDTFLDAAKATLKNATSEADMRTVAGRAYYAAYGYVREQVCEAKGEQPHAVFGTRGHHKDLHRRMSFLGPFKGLSVAYNGLLTLRIRSDYRYDTPISRSDAAGAVRDAQWVLSKLQDIDVDEFDVLM